MSFCRIILISISCLGVMLTACSSDQGKEEELPSIIPVYATAVSLEDLPIYFESVGMLKPSSLVEIKPQASGQLKEVHFTEGQWVDKGALLFTIDQESYLIALEQAEAQLAMSEAAFDIVTKKLNRYASLANKELIPLQEWDELQCQVSKHEAQLKGDLARLSATRLELQRCEIVAPVAGSVGRATVHPGNMISAGQMTPLLTLVNSEVLFVEFTFTEQEYEQLSKEQRAGNGSIDICPLGQESKNCTGMVTFLDHSFDSTTGLLLLQGTISNANHQFLPGQHVKVRMTISTIPSVMVVPEKAVKINQQGPYVFVVKEDNTVEMRPIQVGDEFESKVVVTDGLLENERVVTEGHLRLSPGLKVEIKTEVGDR